MTHNKEYLFEQLKKNKIAQLILDVMYKIPREEFVSESNKDFAYKNSPLSIDCMQTISQPYIVARMTELLLHSSNMDKILEIGTGSGYQAAILSRLVNKVYTLERFKKLYLNSKRALANYKNVYCYHADGFNGLIEQAPFDGIIITAALEQLPKTLIMQMSDKSIIVYPEKTDQHEKLTTLYKDKTNFTKSYYEYVRFVPMLPELE